MAEKQKVLQIKESRVVKKVVINKLGTYARDKQSISAWYCLRKFLQHIKGLKGNYWLLVDERFAMPVSPYQDSYYPDKQTIIELTDEARVADASCNFTRLENELQNRKSRYYDIMGLAAMGLVVALIVIAGIALKGGLIQ